MPHPHRRTWTLGGLDRSLVYRLWFDPVAFRWEVVEAGAVPATTAEQSRETAPTTSAQEPAPARRWWGRTA